VGFVVDFLDFVDMTYPGVPNVCLFSATFKGILSIKQNISGSATFNVVQKYLIMLV